jgi:ABC-2 type transport system permease protein
MSSVEHVAGATVASEPSRRPRSVANGSRGLVWLIKRETLRVWKLWTQTVLAPIVSASLFIVVFGLSLGGRIKEIDGVPYKQFIVPGLIVMAMVQASYANNSASVFQARSDRYINDVLSAPMKTWQMNLGYNVGGWLRAGAIGIGMMLFAVPVTGVPIREPLVLIVAALLGLVTFGAVGTIVGIFAETFDHHQFVNNIVILPLAFLGGTFYSVDRLDSPWHELSHVNPLFYLINAVRYGFVGQSDAPIGLCLAVCVALAVPAYLWSQWLFTTGRKLKA